MNLYDIVKRMDAALVIEAGSVEPAFRGGPGGFIGARVGPRTRLKLTDMASFAALRLGAPLGWQVIEGEAAIVVGPHSILIESDTGAVIRSGAFFDARFQILPLAIGDGVEIGPGRNPHVKASAATRVRYLENVSQEEWLARYHLEPSPESDAMWADYLAGDAQTLDGIEDGTLDFIYSSHVFEHLMNPLGVLANWSARLKPGGSVLAVVPDSRYCFDLRQEPSTLAELERERIEGQWTPPREKYEKWCAGTMIGRDPESYIQRDYPIHLHYYTPDIFGQLAARAMGLGLFRHFELWCEPNAKDFAIRLETAPPIPQPPPRKKAVKKKPSGEVGGTPPRPAAGRQRALVRRIRSLFRRR